MKKQWIILLLCCTLCLGWQTAAAENRVTVGITTPFSGFFSTGLWGSNAADLAVRDLMHGTELAFWDTEKLCYAVNPAVVSRMVQTDREGKKVYTLELVEGLRWSDGSPMTAADYAFSLLVQNASAMATLGADTRGYLDIEGMEEYVQGDSAEIAGVRMPDANTLEITLRKDPRNTFEGLGVLSVRPLPQKSLLPECTAADEGKGIFLRVPLTTSGLYRAFLEEKTGYEHQPAVVSGAYRMESREPQKITLKRNPYYPGNPSGILPEIEEIVLCTLDPQAAVAAMKNGSVDILARITLRDTILECLALKGQSYASVAYPRAGLFEIMMCCERKAVSQPEVRQAVALCLDKKEMVKRLVRNFGEAAEGFYGRGQWAYRLAAGLEKEEGLTGVSLLGVKKYGQDILKAKALLEEAGWKQNPETGIRSRKLEGEEMPLELTLAVSSGSTQFIDAAEECLVVPLAKAGIKLNIVKMDPAELLQMVYRRQERTVDMIALGTDFGASDDYAVRFSAAPEDQGYGNRSGIRDEKLDQLGRMLCQVPSGDVKGYCMIWASLQERFMEVLPAIPVYTNDYYDFVRKDIAGYHPELARSVGESLIPVRWK